MSESRGRTHTSTVTVAVLDAHQAAVINIDERDLDIRTYRGSGPGGQHKNKTDSAVEITHIPTGIKAKSENERKQENNKSKALKILRKRLREREKKRNKDVAQQNRCQQIGYGGRAEKIRTVRIQANEVIDHRTNKRMKANKYLRGFLEDLR